MVAFYVPIGLSVVTPPSITYLGVATSTATTGTTFTFSGVSFGPARGDRTIIIGAGVRDTNISSLTIGGLTGQIASGSKITNPSPNSFCSAIYAAQPTGTSGNIVMTVPNSINMPSIEVYAVYGLLSTISVDGSSATRQVNTTSASVNVSVNGIVVAYGMQDNIGTTPTFSYSGVTKDDQTRYSNNFGYVTSGSRGPALTAITPLSVSVTTSQTGSFSTYLSLASYR